MRFGKTPSDTFPTSDYHSIVKMSNHAVVGVFRRLIFSVGSRYAARVPAEHDAYIVTRTPERVTVQIFNQGKPVYRCIFVPPVEY